MEILPLLYSLKAFSVFTAEYNGLLLFKDIKSITPPHITRSPDPQKIPATNRLKNQYYNLSYYMALRRKNISLWKLFKSFQYKRKIAHK